MTAGNPEHRSIASIFFRRLALIGVAGGTALFSVAGCGSDDHAAPDAAALVAAPVATAPVAAAPVAAAPVAPAPVAAAPVDAASTPPPDSTVANQAPTISGTPPASITPGATYAFTPAAKDADGDVLTFAVDGKPAWTAFEPSTGRLSGSPTQNDVGTSAPIAISATDGEASVALAAFTIDVVGTAPASVPLVWVPPTENEDGSRLADLAGYKIYWGTSAGDYPNSVTLMNPGVTRYLVEQLAPATWYFVMTAVTAGGLESAKSKAAAQEVR
jgi:hypothetical protein